MDGWIFISFLVFFILAFQDVLHRYLMKEGFQAIELVLYGFIPTMIAAILYIYIQNISLIKPTKSHVTLFIVSGILSFFGFLLLRHAQIHSPNIGYVNAIVYSSVLLTILLTGILFKDTLQWQGIVGAMFVVMGIGLITSMYK